MTACSCTGESSAYKKAVYLFWVSCVNVAYTTWDFTVLIQYSVPVTFARLCYKLSNSPHLISISEIKLPSTCFINRQFTGFFFFNQNITQSRQYRVRVLYLFFFGRFCCRYLFAIFIQNSSRGIVNLLRLFGFRYTIGVICLKCGVRLFELDE